VRRAEVVHHDDVAGAQRRREVLVEETSEHRSRRTSFHRHQRPHPIERNGADHREHGAAVARHFAERPVASRRPGVLAHHRDVRTGLAEKDQVLGRGRLDLFEEILAPPLDVRAAGLARDDALFSCVPRSLQRSDHDGANHAQVVPVTQQHHELLSGSVPLLVDESLHGGKAGFVECRDPPPSAGLRFDAPRAAVPRDPSVHHRDTDGELPRERVPVRLVPLPRFDHALARILRVRLRHPGT
jgi:hypothetical protein